MKVIEVESEGSEWDSFVQNAKGATSYHQFGWKAIIGRSFGHRCYYLAAIDDEGTWHGVLPLVHMQSRIFGNFFVSVPFVNYGGVLYRSESVKQLLLDRAEQLRKTHGAKFVELRHLEHGHGGMPARLDKVTMILDLSDDIDSQWKALKSEVRNRIRKSRNSGLQPVTGHLELLDEFYDVFCRNMRDLGTPVYAKEFFRNVLETFPDTTRIFAVRYQDKIIGAAIAYWYGNVMENPWVSSIRDYRKLAPNNMLYWEMICHAIDSGFKKFDFGRSTMSEAHEGTYNYKKQWGAKPVQLYWEYLKNSNDDIPSINPSNPKYQTAIRVWQHLPVPVTRLLGPAIVRNIP